VNMGVTDRPVSQEDHQGSHSTFLTILR
jgi:hypothetical protein